MTARTTICGILVALGLIWAAGAGAAPGPGVAQDRQHLIFWAGTPQELEVYKIFGRLEGPTIMIMGGIQGDEPGGFMSADLYADLALKRGNLIVVPRANFKSIIQSHRGPDGDMNRKFEGDLSRDPDQNTVEILKDLMAESDLVLNLHDGSGYYRPTWESDMANPSRYGQCIIADTEVYTDPVTGRTIPLVEYARKVVERVNEDIPDSLYKFHFFNTNTGAPDSKYQEQRKSATYYALTQLGIPAFGVETSKQLPSLEMKIHQHNLAVNAFLDIFGVELEQPRINLEPPELGYVVISVNNELPVAVADGQTLEVARGDTIEVVHVGANYDRGLAVDVLGLGGLNDLRRPLTIDRPTAIIVQKDHTKIGRINVGLLPADQAGRSPRLSGEARLRPPRAGTPVSPEILPGKRAAAPTVAASAGSAEGTESTLTGAVTYPSDSEEAAAPAEPDEAAAPADEAAPPADEPADVPADDPADEPAPAGPGQVTAFVIEVDGRTVEIQPGQEVEILIGSQIKMVDLKSDGALPAGVVMNLKGFVPKSKQYKNNGEDRGFTADTAKDMMSAFSVRQKGTAYELLAEKKQAVLASSTLKLVPPRLQSVTFEVNGQSQTVKIGNRHGIPAGTDVTVTEVKLASGRTLSAPRFTLGGHPFPGGNELPQTVTMPDYNANLAVFNGEELAGKITWFPR